ncbi:MAG: glycosyltransferase family 4 protein [Nitrospirae bacterium]|nr:glycosyltransferase family 4 protein [Nitrospirota bacterium]
MKILCATHNLNYEGAPLFLLRLAAGLKTKGHEPIVFSPADGPVTREFESAGIRVLISPLTHAGIGREAFDREVARTASRFEGLGIELVLCNTLNTYYALYLARVLGKPALWCIHECAPPYDHFRSLCATRELTQAALEAFALPARLVCVSQLAARMYGGPEAGSCLTVIRHGIDLDAVDRYAREHDREALRRARGVEAGTLVVTIVGTVCDRKGQLVFVRAAERLLAGHRRLRFFIVGARGGAYAGLVERTVAERGLAGAVTIVPETRDVYAFFRLSDIVVSASYEEPFGLAVLEAMAFGVPVVGTDVLGVAEHFENGRELLLTPPGDDAALADRIALLCDDPRLAAALGGAAARRVHEGFAAGAMVDAYERVLRECVALPPCGYRLADWRRRRPTIMDDLEFYIRTFVTSARRTGVAAAVRRAADVLMGRRRADRERMRHAPR